MKFAEISTGAELFYSGDRDWHLYAFSETKNKATVVDGDNLYTRATYRRDIQPISVGQRGGGVLIELGPEHHRHVVPLAHLHGPWKKTAADVRANIRIRDQQRRDAQRAVEDRKATEEAAVAAAATIGVRAFTRSSRFTPAVEVHADEFTAMVDALAAAGWKWQPADAGPDS